MRWALAFLLIAAQAVQADILVPARTIRAGSVIGPEDLVIKQVSIAGALSDPSEVIGQEARIALYPGRPMRPGDIGPPAIVERNQMVPLIYARAGLRISTAGRALGRGADGDMIRVMNLSSRNILFGLIRADGSVHVE
ncbi:flagellar basal body P-ring formation chaperone FlgA [Thalassococcus sp. S3]|uniref:flagellar basal body P-ring formation chaperone FlgA n=1 Tax=Thalassococcus sp. S3 TaxID=2017482 RepID=UPI0010240601|nr:flagellar basal body P-ring formation chaperone FlgA [Thalassococcus sp. S3]QBF29702.1 flagella basal body P-ring formation protein FlgA [Thalassococcus sp. S3]